MVGRGFGGLGAEDDEDDPAQDEDEADELEPAGLSDVVKPSCGDGDGWEECAEEEEQRECVEEAGGFAEGGEDDADDELPEGEPPELGAAGTAFEEGVAFPGGELPGDW